MPSNGVRAGSFVDDPPDGQSIALSRRAFPRRLSLDIVIWIESRLHINNRWCTTLALDWNHLDNMKSADTGMISEKRRDQKRA